MEEFYWLKEIEFLGKHVQILMQSNNGPCPLLAIANVLILRGQLKIHQDFSNLSHEHLVTLVADKILELNKIDENDPNYSNFQANLSDAISIIPKLQGGIDVNVKFDDISSFEFTREIEVFDLMKIQLVHAWVVEKDSEIDNAIEKMSYNQIQEVLVRCEELKNKESLDPEETEFVRKGKAISEFLENSASQMTEEGLKRLNTQIPDGRICVLFRNNHFSTLVKHNKKVYILATDLGFRDADQIVWEQLSKIAGDNKYCNSYFQKVLNSASNSPDKVINDNERQAITDFIDHQNKIEEEEEEEKKNKAKIEEEDASLALALSLQEKELYMKEKEERKHKANERSMRVEEKLSKKRVGLQQKNEKKEKKKKKKCVVW